MQHHVHAHMYAANNQAFPAFKLMLDSLALATHAHLLSNRWMSTSRSLSSSFFTSLSSLCHEQYNRVQHGCELVRDIRAVFCSASLCL